MTSPNYFSVTVPGGTNTVSTTVVSSGVGATVKNRGSGIWLIFIGLHVNHTVADTSVVWQLMRTGLNGTLPALGASVGSATNFYTGQSISPVGSGTVPAGTTYVNDTTIDGFSKGDSFTYFLAFFAGAAGTATFSTGNFCGFEILTGVAGSKALNEFVGRTA